MAGRIDAATRQLASATTPVLGIRDERARAQTTTDLQVTICKAATLATEMGSSRRPSSGSRRGWTWIDAPCVCPLRGVPGRERRTDLDRIGGRHALSPCVHGEPLGAPKTFHPPYSS